MVSTCNQSVHKIKRHRVTGIRKSLVIDARPQKKSVIIITPRIECVYVQKRHMYYMYYILKKIKIQTYFKYIDISQHFMAESATLNFNSKMWNQPPKTCKIVFIGNTFLFFFSGKAGGTKGLNVYVCKTRFFLSWNYPFHIDKYCMKNIYFLYNIY